MSTGGILSIITLSISLTQSLVVAAFARARGRPELLWVTAACLGVVGYSLSNLVTVTPGTSDAAVIASGHLGAASAGLHVYASLRFARGRAARFATRVALAVERAVLVAMVLALVPGVIHETKVSEPLHYERLDTWYRGAAPTALTPLVYIVVCVGLALAVRNVVRSASSRSARYTLALAYVIFGLSSLNDLLVGLQIFSGPFVAQLGVVPVLLALSYDLGEHWGDEARQLSELRERLEERVADRTAALARAHGELAHQERLVALGQLAASVGHEINNPLTYVHGNLTELRALAADDQQRALAEEALDGVDRIETIVSELRVLSRRDHEKAGPVAITELFGTVQRATRHLQTEDFQVVVMAPEGLQVVGVAPRLVQALVNLVRNGLQALPDDGRRHSVRLVGRRRGEEALITVEDDGVGMTGEELEHLFEPFKSARQEGLGLGLAITHAIITQSGGTIAVESKVGVGTRFSISLPVARSSAQAMPALDSVPVVDDAWLAGRRILLVDDEPLVARVVARMLAPAEVVTVRSAIEARTKLEQDRFDLIVCDQMMPKMTGLQLWQELQRERSILADHFLLVTGGACDEEARQLLEVGGPPWLSKPVRRPQLLATATELLADRLAAAEEPLPADSGAEAAEPPLEDHDGAIRWSLDALRKRVDVVAPGVILMEEVEDARPETLKIMTKRVLELGEQFESYGLVIDLVHHSGATTPEYRSYIPGHLAALWRASAGRMQTIVVCLGASLAKRVVTKILVHRMLGLEIQVEPDVVSGIARVRALLAER